MSIEPIPRASLRQVDGPHPQAGVVVVVVVVVVVIVIVIVVAVVVVVTGGGRGGGMTMTTTTTTTDDVADVHVFRYAGRGWVWPRAHNSHPDVVLVVVLVIVTTTMIEQQARDQRSGEDAVPREGGEAEFQRQEQNATTSASNAAGTTAVMTATVASCTINDGRHFAWGWGWGWQQAIVFVGT